MLKAEHLEANTLYCVHGRHGSQSLARLTQTKPEFKKIHRLENSAVMSDHYRGKVRTFTREPMEKFQSALSWYINRQHAILTQKLHGEVRFLMKHEPDYATTQKILWSMIFSSVTIAQETMGTKFNLDNQLIRASELSHKFQFEFHDYFQYDLGEPHMNFNNLSLVCLVALGLDIEVIDVKDINKTYAELGYTDGGQTAGGKYVMDDIQKSFYADITEIYMDSLSMVSENFFYSPSIAEFQEVMNMEIQAYNALNSHDMQADCKKFLLDLFRKILNNADQPYDLNNPKTEYLYLIQSIGSMVDVANFLRLIPYKSELYPVVCFLAILMGGQVSGEWKDWLAQSEEVLNANN